MGRGICDDISWQKLVLRARTHMYFSPNLAKIGESVLPHTRLPTVQVDATNQPTNAPAWGPRNLREGTTGHCLLGFIPFFKASFKA